MEDEAPEGAGQALPPIPSLRSRVPALPFFQSSNPQACQVERSEIPQSGKVSETCPLQILFFIFSGAIVLSGRFLNFDSGIKTSEALET